MRFQRWGFQLGPFFFSLWKLCERMNEKNNLQLAQRLRVGFKFDAEGGVRVITIAE